MVTANLSSTETSAVAPRLSLQCEAIAADTTTIRSRERIVVVSAAIASHCNDRRGATAEVSVLLRFAVTMTRLLFESNSTEIFR